MTIQIGTWIIPSIITILAFVVMNSLSQPSSGGGYSTVGDGIESMLLNGAALIISLIAWFIWALLT